MSGHSANRETQLISKAGAILRKLTPPRIATLLLVREGIETQREMADRLNRAPPTISNYIESLEDLPVSLVETAGSNHSGESNHWTTSEGNQIVSAICRFASNYLEVDLQKESWSGDSTAERLDELDSCLNPLHTFRTDSPFFILYAMGITGSSGWMVDFNREPISIRNIVTDVKRWVDDSITRKQIRSRLNTFKEAGSVEIDGQEARLSEKGLEQCRLLDQVMQMFTNTAPPGNNDESRAPAVYQSDDGAVLPVPSSITAAELEQLAIRFNQEHDSDIVLKLAFSQD